MAMLFMLSACGFEPMYGAQSAGGQVIASATPDIEIANIPDREGQYLRNILIDKLYSRGRPANAAYELKFSPLAKEIVNIGIEKNATATRAQMQISTQMQLVEKGTGRVLLQRDLKTIGAYNLLDNQLATMVSQKNITESIIQELSDNALTEIDLYFRRKAQAG
jgi:LPS-assembly lipoprotein